MMVVHLSGRLLSSVTFVLCSVLVPDEQSFYQ